MIGRPIRILGIDPGLRRTGWGVVDAEGNRLSFVACGSVDTDERADLATRLVTIHDGLARAIDTFRPAEAAVELRVQRSYSSRQSADPSESNERTTSAFLRNSAATTAVR
jgi:Crossover junction endodeoxyribonuclease RuvC